MTTINTRAAPKEYFPFSFDTVPLPQKLPPTTRIRPSGHFYENIGDFFYNEKLEMGGVFSLTMPAPTLRWHPAKKDTAAKFRGHLGRVFPELGRISEKALDALIKDARDREE